MPSVDSQYIKEGSKIVFGFSKRSSLLSVLLNEAMIIIWILLPMWIIFKDPDSTSDEFVVLTFLITYLLIIILKWILVLILSLRRRRGQ